MKFSKHLPIVIVVAAILSVALACSAETETVTVVETVIVEVEKEVVKEVMVVATPTPGGEAMMEKGDGAQRGGDLVVAFQSPWRKWDISTAGGVTQVSFLQRHYNPLLQVSPQSEEANYTIIPALAKSWEFNDTFDSITVELHEGVKFHDGSPLTMEDVIYTFELAREPPEGRPQPRGAGLRAIANMEALDDLTLKIDLESPSVDFVNEIANPWQPIFKKETLQLEGGINGWERIIGTGPFKIADATQDEFTRSERFEDYHLDAPDGKPFPYLDRVRSIAISEEPTRTAAVETGQADIGSYWGGQLGNALASEEKAAGEIVLQRSTISALYALALNGTKPPFDDVRARKAMYLAINIQDIIDLRTEPGLPPVYLQASFFGTADPFIDEVPDLPVNDPAMREANIEEAKRLFAEVGLTEVEIVTNNIPLYGETSQLIGQQLEDIGVKTSIEVKDVTGWGAIRGSGDYTAFQLGAAFLYPNPLYVINTVYNSGVSGFIHHNPPRPDGLDELISRAKVTPDGPDRLAIFKDISTIMAEEWVPSVPMYGGYKDDFYLVRSHVQNYNGYFQTSRFHNNSFYNVWRNDN